MVVLKSWRRIVGIVGTVAGALLAYGILTNFSSIHQTASFLSKFTIKELFVLHSTFRLRQPDPLSSNMIVLRMRADPGAIREVPNPNGAIVSTVPAGTTLRPLSEKRAWYLVEPREDADGPSFRKGYVSVSDVEWAANCVPAEMIDLGPGDRFRDCAAAPEMIVVPAGSFMMGSPASEEYRLPDEGPQRKVEITTPFAAGVYEVTFEQWDACQRTGGCGPKEPHDLGLGRGNYPVMNIDWPQARKYVRWLSAITGKRYRLLSEAEWEYAARAGTTAPRPGSGSDSSYCEHLNGLDLTALKLVPDVVDAVGSTIPCSDGYPAGAVVGSFSPNAFGLYDMIGNVSEWTQDCYNADYLGGPTDGSAWETGDCRFRISRGGAWAYSLQKNRTAARTKRTLNSSYSSLGLRVARRLD